MQNLTVSGYTAAQTRTALLSGVREVKFRYDLLASTEVYKSALETVESCSISMSYFANKIKRSAKIRIRDDGTINYLTDRIKPYFMLKMPDGGWAEWPLGIFILSSPARYEMNGEIYRAVEAYDGLQVLTDDKFTSRYTVASGTNYVTAIKTILTGAGITKQNIEPTSLTLPNAREWEPGTEKLTAIKELLADINYTQLWCDENGFYTAGTYTSPSVRAAEFNYLTDNMSVIHNGLEDELDLFNVANSWVVVSSNAETEPLISTYTNSNASSPTSTVSRGRTIVDYRQIDSIANQASLDAYVERLAFAASQVYGHITFGTAIMPFHSFGDVIHVTYDDLGINDKYSETSWEMELKAGGIMRHEARKVVDIS